MYQQQYRQNTQHHRQTAYSNTTKDFVILYTKLIINIYRVSQNKGVRNGKKGCVTVELIIHPYIIKKIKYVDQF